MRRRSSPIAAAGPIRRAHLRIIVLSSTLYVSAWLVPTLVKDYERHCVIPSSASTATAMTGFGKDADTAHLSNLAGMLYGSCQETPYHLPSICQAFLNLAEQPDKRGKESVSVMSVIDAGGPHGKRRRRTQEEEEGSGSEDEAGVMVGEERRHSGHHGASSSSGGGARGLQTILGGKRSRRDQEDPAVARLFGSPP